MCILNKYSPTVAKYSFFIFIEKLIVNIDTNISRYDPNLIYVI